MKPPPPIRYAAHGWLCTAIRLRLRLRRRDACVAHSRPSFPRGKTSIRRAAPGDYIARLARVFHVKEALPGQA